MHHTYKVTFQSDEVWNWYNGLPGLRIERVYSRANGNRWEVCEWWN